MLYVFVIYEEVLVGLAEYSVMLAKYETYCVLFKQFFSTYQIVLYYSLRLLLILIGTHVLCLKLMVIFSELLKSSKISIMGQQIINND